MATVELRGRREGQSRPGERYSGRRLLPTTFGRRSKGASHHPVAPYVFLLPFLLLFSAFTLAPIVYDGYLSLFTSTLFGTHFTGLHNYGAAVSSPAFWSSLLRVLEYSIILVPIMLFLATVFALLLDLAYIPFGKVFRLVLFLPYTIPGAIVVLIWSFLYEPSFGPLTKVLQAAGISGVNFLGQGLILGSIGNIGVWALTGFNMLIIYTALRGVSNESVEAAVVDGASVWCLATRIKLPQVRRVVLGLGLFGVLGAVQLFTEPQILSPQTDVISSQFTPAMLVYNAVTAENNNGYAAAVAFLLTAIALMFSAALLFAFFVKGRGRGRHHG